MKITTFNPQIVTQDAEPVIKLFEELGFEKRHAQEGIGEANVLGIRMKDANGFALDISETEALPAQDEIAIRINVDNFDEAYEVLKAHGFINYYGDHVIDTKTAKSAMMISQSGFAVNLIEHIK